MSAHNPGPWHWEPRTIDGDPWIALVAANGERVLSVPVVDNTAEPSANARLIAAAPDLLERYKRAVAIIGAECDPDEEDQREAEDYIRGFEGEAATATKAAP